MPKGSGRARDRNEVPRARRGRAGASRLPCPAEVSERLVGSPAFKAGGTGDPRPAGSIPVHLRHEQCKKCPLTCIDEDWVQFGCQYCYQG